MAKIPTSANPLRGVVLILSAVFIFACMDSLGKILMTRYNVPLVMTVRYSVNLLLLVLLFGPTQRRTLIRVNRGWLVLFRGLSLAMSSLFAGLAFQRMPVAESTAIFYLSPIGVLLLAKPLLGEKVGFAGWIAAVLGLSGVLLVSRPGSGLNAAGVFFALICAALSTAYALLSRLLAATETTSALMFYVALVGIGFFSMMLPFSPASAVPGWMDILLFGSLGALALVGHYLFTSAYRSASASLLAPVNYMHLVWAGILGWLVFDHVPDFVSLIGMALIACAGVSIALRSYFTKREQIISSAPIS